MPEGVDWPMHPQTGEVFNLNWLDSGTRKAMSADEEEILRRAAEADEPSEVLWVDSVPARVRTEYQRRRRIAQFGAEFLHQPQRILVAGDVRGIYYLEWREHIEHLSRTNHVEEALELTYSVIDAAERVDRLERRGGGAVGWYERAAILLRKLGDHEAEVRLIEDVQRAFPDRDYLGHRAAKARDLLAKSAGGQ